MHDQAWGMAINCAMTKVNCYEQAFHATKETKEEIYTQYVKISG